MTHDEALHYVAQMVHAIRADSNGDDWDGYPEIGEDDWYAINKLIQGMVKYPPVARYDEAYELLSARAAGAED